MYYSPKTSTDGLVFHYDTGNTVRSYLGEPTVNLHPNPEDVSSWTGNLFNNWIQSAVTSNSVIAPNGTLTGDRLGDGYGRFNASVSITGGQTYTYSVYLKNVSLTNNFAIVYAWGLNGTLVSYGTLVDVVVSQLSNTQWTRITGTIIAPGSGVNQVQFGPCPFTGYGNPSGQQIDVWGGMIEQKSHVTPYTTGTRSASQGLKDLTAKNTINLTNVSFDSNAQMTFDGTDDLIYTADATHLNPGASELTIELVFNCSNASVGEGILYNKENLYETAIHSGYFQYAWQPHWNWDGDTSFPVSNNTWYHAVVTYNNSIQRMYRNGVDVYSRNQTGNIGSNSNVLSMGARGVDGSGGSGYNFFPGQIPVAKIYNRALTADEIQRNFNAVKSRFNIA